MQKAAVLLVEDRGAEAALARTAIALHRPQARVLEAANARAATKLLKQEKSLVRLVILGERAIPVAGKLVVMLEREGLEVPLVGIAPALAQAAKRHALKVGVRSLHTRPRQWRRYAVLMERLLKKWL